MKRFFLFVVALLTYISAIIAQSKEMPYRMKHEDKFAGLPTNQIMQRKYVLTDTPAKPVRQLAEFEPMKGVYITYDSYSGFGIPVSAIKEMAEDAIVMPIVENSSAQTSCSTELANASVNMSNVQFLTATTDSWWVRDYGPWFIIDGNDEFAVCDFPYNRPRPNDDQIPIEAANQLGIDFYTMPVDHTGGNYMCDGMGIAASTDLVREENYSLTYNEIDSLHYHYLGIHNYHVTIDPLGDYIKHIDCWGKFLAPDKVLIGQVNQSHSQYDEYELVANYFANEISSYGTPYKVYRVYTPGDPYTTPYSNSLILNNKVFLPVEGNQYDADAVSVYQQAMPGYEIFPVTGNGWYNTDALHCRTREMADIEMLYIHHIPYQPLPAGQSKEGYTINAKIKAYSQQALYNDSLLLYYKINDGAYSTIALSGTGNDLFEATIPAITHQRNDTTYFDTIKYFLHAADQSGRSTNHPFIGGADPHTFVVSTTVIDTVNIQENQTINPFAVESVFPNPFKNSVGFVIHNKADSKVLDFEIINTFGNVVYTEKLIIEPNKRSFYKINTVKWAKGMYIYRFSSNTFQINGKILKVE